MKSFRSVGGSGPSSRDLPEGKGERNKIVIKVSVRTALATVGRADFNYLICLVTLICKERYQMNDIRKQAGFSLIELMIVVAIVGILAAIAIPQYNDHIRKGQIVEAHTTLQQAATRLEQYYQDNRNYGTGNFCGGVDVASQAAFFQALTGNLKYFTVTCSSAAVGATAAGQGFVLTATGVATQSVSCYSFTLNQANTRATTGPAAVSSTTRWVASGPSC